MKNLMNEWLEASRTFFAGVRPIFFERRIINIEDQNSGLQISISLVVEEYLLFYTLKCCSEIRTFSKCVYGT